jgi:hypothetical protein
MDWFCFLFSNEFDESSKQGPQGNGENHQD